VPRRAGGAADRAGLTFVELLIAATIFAILGVGLSSHLRAAMVVWRRTNDAADQSQRVRILLRRMGQDLANATVINPQPHADIHDVPHFGSAQLEFITVVPGRDGQPQFARVQHVVYEVVPELSAIDAAAHGPGLIRRAQSYAALRAGETMQSKTTQTSVMLPGVPMSEGFELRYAYRSAEPRGWVFDRKPWSASDHVPRLVEVVIRQLPPKTDSDTQARREPVIVAATTFAVPAGALVER